ncbi:hypothetical protein [Aquimarina mytili]|uniref:Uncharacterized protein n=1 Tax=Aquimarina mytili TaxID=874423 RepID=A0A937A7N2_9FLAO|nr:hypothetical protein [Aquimarina mytili]MBL0685744.1 hypothetical protein [Aquimarina mytili]
MDANTPSIIIQLLLGIVYALPTVAFIIISLYYLKKAGSTIDGVLILIGNIIIFTTIILNQASMVLFVYYRKWSADVYSYITMGTGILSFIGSILFIVGLSLLVKRVVKNYTSNEN